MLAANRETHATRAVSGRVLDPGGVVAKPPGAFAIVEKVNRRLPFDPEAEGDALLHDGVVEELVLLVQADGGAKCCLGTPDTRDVVEVGVCEEDVLDGQAEAVHRLEQLVDLVAWVDDDALASALAADHVAVLHERRVGVSLENHG